MNRPQRVRELWQHITELDRQRANLVAEKKHVERGCGRRLAPDQWYGTCAGFEMEGLPQYCTECGGKLILADQPAGDE